MIGIYIGITVVILLIGIIIINTLNFKTEIPSNETVTNKIKKVDSLVNKLSKAIQIQTIGYKDKTKNDYSQFEKFHQMLQEEFPLLHKNLERTVINKYSLLYKWAGNNSCGKPALYMAHIDVVPVSKSSYSDWKEDPFSGAIKDGFLWGRGSLDTKNTLICAMESVERLLEQGFVPKEDIYLAFGHDEETGGNDGATNIATHLEKQGILIDYILDEGGVIATNSIAGISEPVAVVGIGEKGYLDATVTIRGEGGHASMPPKHTALGQVSKLINSMEENQMPMKLLSPVEGFLKTVGPKMGIINRVILANLWLFKPLFMKIFSKSNMGNALLRTTTAATMSSASVAANVLPKYASVTFNFRIALGDSIEAVVNHINKQAKDMEVDILIGQHKEPSIISSADSVGYKRIRDTIWEVFGSVLVAPYVVLAGTDSVKYESICTNIYRFAPVKVTKEEIATIHNTNERISLENIERCLSFYMELMKRG